MEYEIKTHKGITFGVNGEGLNLTTFRDQLNNRSLVTIALSNVVMSKNNIKVVAPKVQPEDGPNVYMLTTNDGETYKVEIDDYDSEAISVAINDMRNDFVLIGNIIVHKNSFDLLKSI